MNKHFMRAAVGIAVLVGLLGTSACFRHHTPAERADWVTGKIARQLDLNDQQKAKLAVVKDELLAARAEAQKERRGTMEEVIAQVKTDRLDEAKLAQLIEQHQAERTRMMQRVLPRVSEWHASLRPDQKAEAAKLIERWTDHSPWNKMDPAG
ncbi:MAG: Spy/CpxP family protein refolding chaperone [Nitrospira sp.]|nr:Spy/CpxP family protein refolding chaperone [Nitrospira sp.]